MVKPQDTRIVVAMLKKQGWKPIRTKGSHTQWRGLNGTTYSIPDGHRTISAGVYRNILAKIEEDKRK